MAGQRRPFHPTVRGCSGASGSKMMSASWAISDSGVMGDQARL